LCGSERGWQQNGQQEHKNTAVGREHRKKMPQFNLKFDYMNMWFLGVRRRVAALELGDMSPSSKARKAKPRRDIRIPKLGFRLARNGFIS